MQKILFIDRDGTLIVEPPDQQIDQLEKLSLLPQVIPCLLRLQQSGYTLIMISNQDGLGTPSFPTETFNVPHHKLMELFTSQGIFFAETLLCPHFSSDHCECRKPKIGMVLPYLQRHDWDRRHSYVIGDRQSDIELANNMGITGILYNAENDWPAITETLLHHRKAVVQRKTRETDIQIEINLDNPLPIEISTSIGFFDHMLEQLAKHAGFSLKLKACGDTHIDEHHLVEDTAIALGQTLKQALGNKMGIARYGFLLPMDEAQAQVAIDLSGRAYFVWEVNLPRTHVGTIATEMFPHFFRSFSESLGANLHIAAHGENTHHIIESIFKSVAHALRQAIHPQAQPILLSTKGIL